MMCVRCGVVWCGVLALVLSHCEFIVALCSWGSVFVFEFDFCFCQTPLLTTLCVSFVTLSPSSPGFLVLSNPPPPPYALRE